MDWIEWKGGPQPVPDDTIVEVQYNFTGFGGYGLPKRADEYEWGHIYEYSNIVAYRIVTPAQ